MLADAERRLTIHVLDRAADLTDEARVEERAWRLLGEVRLGVAALGADGKEHAGRIVESYIDALLSKADELVAIGDEIDRAKRAPGLTAADFILIQKAHALKGFTVYCRRRRVGLEAERQGLELRHLENEPRPSESPELAVTKAEGAMDRVERSLAGWSRNPPQAGTAYHFLTPTSYPEEYRGDDRGAESGFCVTALSFHRRPDAGCSRGYRGFCRVHIRGRVRQEEACRGTGIRGVRWRR